MTSTKFNMSQWLGFPCNRLRRCCLSLRRFRPPAAATRHLWISDPNNTMDMGIVANMVAKFRLQMASDGFNPSQTWQGMLVLRSYTYLLVHLMCWMPRMPPEFSPMLCKFLRQSSALKNVLSKTRGISAMDEYKCVGHRWSMPCSPILLKGWSTTLTMGASGQIVAAIRPIFIADGSWVNGQITWTSQMFW